MSIEPAKTDDLERTGATRFGIPIVCAWFKMADGRMVKVELPYAAPPTADKDRAAEISLNNYQRKIVLYMGTLAEDARVRGDLIATGISEVAGTIRKHLSDLVAKEVLSNDRNMDGYARGKFFAHTLQSLEECSA